MAKNNNTGAAGASDGITSPSDPQTPKSATGDIRLTAPKFRTPHHETGEWIVVTAESLAADPKQLAYMREKFPECFAAE